MEIDSEMITKGEEEKKKPIVVILVGAPGSGKSTFCDRVMGVSTRSWVRVCQDTIGNGKAGTKVQCLMSAATALKDGKSVLIDRCNLEREQRVDFVKLGSSHQVDVHAMVLDLPAKLCISRSVKRTGHEGNLQGGKAAAVVNRMLQKKELPKLSEGFSRITCCQNEADVQAAMNTYGALSSSDVLPSGYFGQKTPDAKIQLGIMKFLKKVDAPTGSGTIIPGASDKLTKEKHPVNNEPECDTTQKADAIAGSVTNILGTTPESTKGKHSVTREPEGNASEQLKKCQEQEKETLGGIHLLDAIPTLAFPSISTADFQFNLEKASDIIVEKVEEFVNNHENARLVLVDLSHGSKILSLVRTKAARKNIDPKKFFTFVGDITRLRSDGGLHCNVIANAANWRLKPGGGGVNAAIFSAAGPALDTATKERAGSLSPGNAVVVPLPSISPLFAKEGVTHVIHVLGPNMNPQRPNCLNNNYTKGCKVLAEAYKSLFESFESILKTPDKLSDSSSSKHEARISELHDQISNCDRKSRRESLNNGESNKKFKCVTDKLGHKKAHFMDGKDQPNTEKSTQNMTKDWGSWAQALYHIAMNPEKHKNDVLEVSDDVVVLNDAYPKAQKHILVLARADGLEHLADVRKENLGLLRRMHTVGLKWAEKLMTENESLIFRLGYHSAPSMRQLHLHVISQDFDSKHLKNKKHWNSFNSPFFLDSLDVIDEVNEHGKATLKDEKKFLSMELRCNRCRSAHPNIPLLKTHISNCRAPFPASLLENGRLVLAPSKHDAC